MRRLSDILAAKQTTATQLSLPIQLETTKQPSVSNPSSAKTKTAKPKTAKPKKNSSPTPPADALPPDHQMAATITSFLSAYFEEECKRDPEFAAKYRSGKKTAEQAFHYLYELHRPSDKGQCAATNNDDDNLLAKQFIMDDSISAPKDKAETKTSKSKSKAKQPSLPPAQPKDDADLVLDDVTTPVATVASDEHDDLDDFDF